MFEFELLFQGSFDVGANLEVGCCQEEVINVKNHNRTQGIVHQEAQICTYGCEA